VHVCIINVAINRLGWTLMKDITSQHELSFTAHWRIPLCIWSYMRTLNCLANGPSFAVTYCQTSVPHRNSQLTFNAVFLARLQVS
jgi:hypothetical protein